MLNIVILTLKNKYVTVIVIHWQISCVEYLCDSLCYQLDLVSFVAYVNSAHLWNSKSSLLLPEKEITAIGEDNQSDPFC